MAILSPDTLGGSISASTNRTSASLTAYRLACRLSMFGLTFAPLAFASLLAFIDTFVLSGLKKYSTGDHDYGLAVPSVCSFIPSNPSFSYKHSVMNP